MTWLLLTGAGFAAETALIVALGRQVTGRDDVGEPLPLRSSPPGPESLRTGEASAPAPLFHPARDRYRSRPRDRTLGSDGRKRP